MPSWSNGAIWFVRRARSLKIHTKPKWIDGGETGRWGDVCRHTPGPRFPWKYKPYHNCGLWTQLGVYYLLFCSSFGSFRCVSWFSSSSFSILLSRSKSWFWFHQYKHNTNTMRFDTGALTCLLSMAASSQHYGASAFTLPSNPSSVSSTVGTTIEPPSPRKHSWATSLLFEAATAVSNDETKEEKLIPSSVSGPLSQSGTYVLAFV